MRKVGWQERSIKRIAIFKQDHPLMTLQQVADHFDVSRPYVYKVLKQQGEPTNNRLVKKKAHYCWQCNIFLPTKRKFCSNECSFRYRNIKVNCAVCHVPLYRKRSYLKAKGKQGQKYIYCSRRCLYKRGEITLT